MAQKSNSLAGSQRLEPVRGQIKFMSGTDNPTLGFFPCLETVHHINTVYLPRYVLTVVLSLLAEMF